MKPIISETGHGLLFEMESGSRVRFKVLSRDTGHAFEMYERELPPHTIGADPHVHRSTVETFYVTSGRLMILNGDIRQEYDPGSLLVVPRNTVHAYWNHSDEPATALISFCPGMGHEEFFRELSRLKKGPVERYADDLARLRERFDSQSTPMAF